MIINYFEYENIDVEELRGVVLIMCLKEQTCLFYGETIRLTPQEYKFLLALAQKPEQMVEYHILLNEKPFTYKLLKDNKAQISFKGKVVSTIVGKEYNKLKRVIEMDNIYEVQLFLAKITGQFKHGNER